MRFASSFTVAESVERLRAATTRSVFSSFRKQSASGTVNARKVSLQRVVPGVRNSFKPSFIGAFTVENGHVALVGRFTMNWFVKVFLTFWFGFLLLWITLGAILMVARHQPGSWMFPVMGIVMAAGGIALVKVGKWFSRDDAAWLTETIWRALSPDDTAGQVSTPRDHKKQWPAA